MLRHDRKQKGFTLIEMIGVLAVIAILAAIVAPRIFDAIRDAKIDTLVTNINSVRTSIVDYYADTSAFPQHDPNPTGDARPVFNSLINQPIVPATAFAPAGPQRGWEGPYIDKELENPINPNADFIIADTAAPVIAGGANAPALPVSFDIDGNGVADYSTLPNAAGRIFVISFAIVNGLTVDEARNLSEILDSDLGEVTAGQGAWWEAGRVRTPIGINPLAPPILGENVTMWVYLGSR